MNTVAKIVYWYDRKTRCWVSQKLDTAGNQIGEASYDPTKASRDFVLRQWCAEFGIAKAERI